MSELETQGALEAPLAKQVENLETEPPLFQPAGMPKPAGGVSAGVKTLQRNEERPSSVVHFYHTGT